jgi:hypothetical protein
MAGRNTDPWAEAGNQAVGALFKYYMSQPSAADVQKQQYMKAQMDRIGVQNEMDNRQMGLGDYALPNLSPEIRNDMYRRSIEKRGETDAAKLFGTYVNKPMQVDAGDAKYIVDGSTGMPLPGAEYGVGTAPKVEIDTQGGQVIRTPGVAAPNRPAVPAVGGEAPSPIAHLMGSLIQQESGGDPNAVSPKGATGLTQVMPSTAVDPGFGVKNIFQRAEEKGIPVPSYDEEGAKILLQNPELNVEFGQDYLGAMSDQHGGNERLALASYNAGPGAVARAGGVPNYPETQNYVEKVMDGAQPQQQPTAPQPVVQQDGTTITPLPKSPALQAKEAEKNRQRGLQGDLVNDELNRSLNLLNEKGGAVAGMGSVTSGIPMMPAHDFAQMLDTIKANVGFDKLQSMREASPTGGALGQVSESENKLLQAVFGSLQQSQSPEQLRYNLMRLQNTYNNLIYRGYNDDGSLKLQNDLGPTMHNIPTLEGVGQMNTPEELQGALEFFNYDPPQDIKNAIIQRANVLGL